MHFKVMLGLGNPGSKYKNTYHSVGHLMVDFLIQKNLLPENIIISKNDGYMNESGNSAVKLLKKSGSKPDNLLVIHDDSDIVLGKYKLSIDRSSAGHKGIKNIIEKIGSKNFWRLRIGIRPLENKTDLSLPADRQTPKLPRVKAEEFVLKKIKKEDRKILDKVFEESASSLFS
jgi:PTH1 family peptidyl-tRNA hydrolase